MQNFQKAYNQIMSRMINENRDEEEMPPYEVYEGSDEDIIYIADLDQAVNDLQLRIMGGDHCELKHVAFAKDLIEMGMNAIVEGKVYLLDSPTDFTQPAFVLS